MVKYNSSIIVRIFWCFLAVNCLTLQAASPEAVFQVPTSGGTFGHDRDFLSDFSDSYAHFGSIIASDNGKLSIPANTVETNAGWIVYKYKADAENIVTNLELTLETYKQTHKGGIGVFWTTDSYDGSVAPDESAWTDAQFSFGQWTKKNTIIFYPNNNEFYVAYKIWNASNTGWHLQIMGDKVVATASSKSVVNPFTLQASTMLFDFESPLGESATSKQNIKREKRFTSSGAFSLSFSSSERQKVGKSFLELKPSVTDWSAYSRLIMDVTNLSEIPQILKVYITDSKVSVSTEDLGGSGVSMGSFTLRPQSHTRIDVDLGKRLKKSTTKIDISNIHFLQLLTEKQPAYLYLDNIKIVKSGYCYKEPPLPDEYLMQFASFQQPALVSLREFYTKTCHKVETAPDALSLITSLKQLDNCISELEEHVARADRRVLGMYQDVQSLNGNIRRAESLLVLWKKFKNIRSAVQVGKKQNDVIAGFATSMEQILPRDNPINLSVQKNISVSLAKGEKESFQTVVISGVDLKNVGVIIGDLISDDGSKFSGEYIDTPIVGYVKTQTRPSSGTPYLGWWPDPILSFLQTTDIKAGDAQSFWIRVNAPKDQTAGVYHGAIHVQVDGLTIFSFELTVHVYDFCMPAISPLPTVITFAKTSKDWAYLWEDEKLKVQWADFLADYYISYDNIYTREPDFEIIKYLNKQGRLGMFNLGYFYRSKGTGEAAWKKTMERIGKAYDEAKGLGLLDHAYIYGCDEFRSKHFAAIEEATKELKREFPGVIVMTTAIDTSYGLDSVLKSQDAWCPYTSTFYPEKVRKVRAKGKQVWWYTCCWPHHPYPNFFIEYPAIESRLLMGVITAKYCPDGFLYYQISRWRNNSEPITSGPFTDWNPNSFSKYNGDGSLVYPGPDSTPLSSIRLENFRDGLDDYAYIIILDEIIRQYEAKPELDTTEEAWLEAATSAVRIPWDIVKERYSFTYDPTDVYAYRETLAQLIEKSGMTTINPWASGMGVVRTNSGVASHLTGFNYTIPVEGGVFGHDYAIPDKGFPEDFIDSFSHFGEISGSIMGKLITTPQGNGWVVYAFEAPAGRMVDTIDLDLDIWVASWKATSFKVYWSVGDYDGTVAPDPAHDRQWIDLNCDLYRKCLNKFQKSVVAGKKRFYLAYYLESNALNSWDIQVKRDSVNVSLVPAK